MTGGIGPRHPALRFGHITTLELPGFRLEEHRFPPGHRLPQHVHARPGLALMLSGSFRARSGRQDLVCSAGEALTVPAGALHAEEIGPQGGHGVIVALAPAASDDLDRRSLRAFDLLRGQEVRRFIAATTAALGPASADSPLQVEESLVELLSSLSAARSRACIGGNSCEWLHQARNLVEDNLEEPPSLAQIAASVGVSRAHLARSFRDTFGCTVGEYVRRRRLERAACLLETSRVPLVEIALEAGFYDQSHFSRVFKRRFETTPSAYRRWSQSS